MNDYSYIKSILTLMVLVIILLGLGLFYTEIEIKWNKITNFITHRNKLAREEKKKEQKRNNRKLVGIGNIKTNTGIIKTYYYDDNSISEETIDILTGDLNE